MSRILSPLPSLSELHLSSWGWGAHIHDGQGNDFTRDPRLSELGLHVLAVSTWTEHERAASRADSSLGAPGRLTEPDPRRRRGPDVTEVHAWSGDDELLVGELYVSRSELKQRTGAADPLTLHVRFIRGTPAGKSPRNGLQFVAGERAVLDDLFSRVVARPKR